MKKTGMLQSLLILLFALAYGIASAQDYAVTVTRDTIRGKVKYFINSAVKSSSPASKHIQVTTDQGEKKTFKVIQVLSFKMKDEIYHTVKFESGYTFMKLMRSGYLSLYSYQPEDQVSWDGRYFVKKDGKGLEVPNLSFKKRLTAYLSDCQSIVDNIEAGKYKRSNLIQLVDEYNACINSKSSPLPQSPAEAVWKDFELTVKALPNFDKKADALEMIKEIKSKLSRKETVPSFLSNGLKEALKDQPSVKEDLELVLEHIN